MDWIEKQVPPPSWHDEVEMPKDVDDDYYCPLTSVVRRCYLGHLEQTLLQNYKSCRTQTIQQSTLQDLILHWEQNALRACMVTTIYQKAMRQLINAIKADTKLNKLTPGLTATIKKSQRQHSVDVSTQTEAATQERTRTPNNPQGVDAKHHIKRERSRSVTRDSSDGPFLTPPSDYPLPPQTAKKVARRQLPFPPPDNAPEAHPPCPVPYPFVAPPGYQFLPQQMYATYPVQENGDLLQQCFPPPESFQPISVITNGCTDYAYEHQSLPEPEQEATKPNPTEDAPMETLFDGAAENTAEPDYNWDQIEEEMARLYGQAFEDDGKVSDEPEAEPEPEVKAVPPKEQDQVDLEVLGRLHETQLQSRLDYIRKTWTLERQAKLKRRFVELFGREDDEDMVAQVSPKEAAKCKQRIAPWIVKHLMPLYKEKRIASRHLFKSLAKHISDLLIQRNLHPDECDVWMGVQEFFSGGTVIECEADFSA